MDKSSHSTEEKTADNALAATTSSNKPLVVLLHGITQSTRHLQPISHFLSQQDYPTAIIEYPWRNLTFEQVVERTKEKITDVLQAVTEHLENPDYFIFAHSMGCLITRALLTDERFTKPSVVVMSGPPNQGSESADKLRGFPPFQWIYGSLGWQLGTCPEAIVHQLPAKFPDSIPLGVIAGDRSAFPIVNQLLPKPNDGKVSIASTHLPGENDHVILPVNHDNMFKHPLVFQATLDFFQQQRFQHRPLDERYTELSAIATTQDS